MLRRFSINFALLSMLLDGLSVSGALFMADAVRPLLNPLTFIEAVERSSSVPGVLFVALPVVWVLLGSALSIYDGRRYLRVADEFAALTVAVTISAISSAGILYFSFRDLSRALFVLFVAFALLLSLAWRVLARVHFRIRGSTAGPSRRILIVGAGPLGQTVHDQLVSMPSPERAALVGFVDDSPTGQARAPKLLAGREAIRSVVLERHISDVVIALPYSAYRHMEEVVQRLDDLPVRVWVALGFLDLALYKTAIVDFAGIPMLDLRASAIDEYQRLIKRAFDLLLGLILLVAALPVMGVLALLILAEDGWPVLFSQKRVGENGRIFSMLKFRTMVKGAERKQAQVEQRDEQGNLIHKSKHDPRVTRLGRLLRRFSLDELPQFINVVRGDMSLVGPRPELPYLVEKYKPWQRKRFAVPPGITGWWQVNGRSDKPMHLHTEDDIYYIQNFSIWLDLQIMVRTLWVVLFGKGAY